MSAAGLVRIMVTEPESNLNNALGKVKRPCFYKNNGNEFYLMVILMQHALRPKFWVRFLSQTRQPAPTKH